MTANTSKAQFKIIVDGDACPVKEEILQVATGAQIPVVLVTSMAHYGKQLEGIEYIFVDNFPQAADMAIIKHVRSGDIIITQDYGLAAIGLAKGAYLISFRGMIFTEENIDRLLLQRHIDGKIRRSGGKTKGPKAMIKEDYASFKNNLQQLVQKLLAT
jgi:uncharacterized protein